MATYIQTAREKTRPKGTMMAVYVRLIGVRPGWDESSSETVIAHAQVLGVMLQCTVTAENVAARRLYHSLGFLPYGLERDALCVHGRFLERNC